MCLTNHRSIKLDDYKYSIDKSILTTIAWGFKHPLLKSSTHYNMIINYIESILELIKSYASIPDFNMVNSNS